jgi:hypothetical protein
MQKSSSLPAANMAENFGVLTRISFLLLGTCHSPSWTVRGNQEREKTTNGKKNKYTRTNESGEIFQRAAQALNRNISRVQSGNLGKVSQQGKKVRGKTIGLSKSASVAINSFAFETPPSFGFGWPNAFHQPVTDAVIFKDVEDTTNN